MLKKITSFLLIVLMLLGVLLGLTGCGNNEQQKQQNKAIDYQGKLKIGDYIAYDEGKGNSYTIESSKVKSSKEIKYTTTGNLKWRVCGFDDNGRVQLICDDSIAWDNGSLKTSYTLQNTDEIEKVLDEICAIYGKGNGAESARSIKIEDIKKYVKHDEELKGISAEYYAFNYANDIAPEYEMLFKNEEGIYKKYLINSYFNNENEKYHYSCYGMRIAMDKLYSGTISGIMPIVTLKADVEINGQDENGVWQIKDTDKKYKENSYIEISTAKDYMKLVNGEYSLDGNYILTKDIDLSGENNLKSIANPSDNTRKSFSGIFDGNNHSITGAKITVSKEGNAGLFYSTNGAIIKNLNLKNDEMTIVKNDDEKLQTYYAGILVGSASNTKIINCNINGTITDNISEEYSENLPVLYVGMLAGEITSDSNIYKCSTSGKITTKGNYSASGFANSIGSSTIERCSSSVDLESYRGSIAGFALSISGSRILKSYNTGNVKSNYEGKNEVSGFAGALSSSSYLIQCYAKCNVSGYKMVTGFCTDETTNMAGLIYDSYFIGNIQVTGDSVHDADVFAGGHQLGMPMVYSSYVDANITNAEKKKNAVRGDLYFNSDKLNFEEDEGIGLNTEQFKKKESFELFNFDYVWTWDDKEQRPRLLFEYEI